MADQPGMTAVAGEKPAMPAHPLARAVMRLLTHRSDADLRFVFAAVAERVRPEGDGRRESALAALERCAIELEVTEPTARTYTTWRETTDGQRGAPSVQQIRTIFGSWGRAVQAMPQVPGSDPLVRRLAAKGPKFTNAECLEAMRRWHRETGERTANSFKAWAQRTRLAEGTVRIPASCDPIRERYGSWAAALDTADIPRARKAPQRGRPQRVRGATRDEIIAGLRTAYESLGEPFMLDRYDAWVRRKGLEHGDSDKPFRLCSGRTVCDVFNGRWTNAVGEALGERRDVVVALGQRQTRRTQADLVRAWWECRAALGRTPTRADYATWRVEKAGSSHYSQWPPCSSSIEQRVGGGSWRRACGCKPRDHPMSDATEVAFALAHLVSDHAAFPGDAVRDLHRLLGHRLAAPSGAVLRYDRLQLLLTMLIDTGIVPTVDEYQARRAGDADARQAPAASTLIATYGHWLGACRAAWRFVDRTKSHRVPHTYRHMKARDAYTPRECLDSIVRFHIRFGTWPTEWEFLELGLIERRAARRCGATDPRIPTAVPLYTAFGTFSRAAAAAQRSVPHDRG